VTEIEVDRSNVVVLGLEGPRPQRRLTVAFRVILAIPHYFWLGVLTLVAELVVAVAWFCALVIGRMPEGLGTFLRRYLQYLGRIYSYGYYLLTDRYPPFALDDVDYPVTVEAPHGGRLNRAAVLFRLVLLIPCAIAVWIVTMGLNISLFFIWLIVLVAGRTPNALFGAQAAVLRYQLRVFSFAAMLTSEYPRGLFGDRDVVDLDEVLAPDGPAALPPRFDTPASDMPAQPRVTRLVLSKASKRIVVLFIVLGSIFGVGVTVISALAADGSEAADELFTDHLELEAAIRDWSSAVQTCGLSATGPDCIHNADRQLILAVERFREDVRSIDFPPAALGVAQQLVDDADEMVELLSQRAQTTDVATFQQLSGQLQETGTRFDRDYIELLRILQF
jgi:hypothetical protein